jgi:hypothetical protein
MRERPLTYVLCSEGDAPSLNLDALGGGGGCPFRGRPVGPAAAIGVNDTLQPGLVCNGGLAAPRETLTQPCRSWRRRRRPFSRAAGPAAAIWPAALFPRRKRLGEARGAPRARAGGRGLCAIGGGQGHPWARAGGRGWPCARGRRWRRRRQRWRRRRRRCPTTRARGRAHGPGGAVGSARAPG